MRGALIGQLINKARLRNGANVDDKLADASRTAAAGLQYGPPHAVKLVCVAEAALKLDGHWQCETGWFRYDLLAERLDVNWMVLPVTYRLNK
uniref:Uncharacterized protein n=1 Tax=Salmonella sp. TaxID=599 RepID=A0A482EVK2_SALSP|nr:hypothetical protein [Salmonella sp.]QBM91452.1 hypothetical protein NNIBIDOC_00123 [Salmonella sp.]